VTTVTLAGGASRATVAGAGLSFRTARWRAALRAVAQYAHSCLDPRRTVQAARGPQVWGYDLASGAARLVPAALGLAPGDAHGVAAGYDWDEAVTAGLLGWCRAVTVAEVAREGPAVPQLDLDALALDEDATTYRRLLDIAGVSVRVYDVTGSPRVPTFAFCVDARTVAYACHPSPGDAVREGLEQALLDYQARANVQPAYAPPVVPDLPPHRRGPVRPGGVPTGPVGVDAIVAALAGAGHAPVVVPLDHDPSLVSVIPYVVNVVLADD
jgi:hypothetical protein